MALHTLYETSDIDKPEVICDRNGEVVLAMCKKCGLAESQFDDKPYCEGAVQLVNTQPQQLNSERTVAIDKGYHWREIDAHAPRGVKLQLINRAAGVAVYGSIGTDPGFWTHWAPVPTFDKKGTS